MEILHVNRIMGLTSPRTLNSFIRTQITHSGRSGPSAAFSITPLDFFSFFFWKRLQTILLNSVEYYITDRV